jgi:hypothetical protein
MFDEIANVIILRGVSDNRIGLRSEAGNEKSHEDSCGGRVSTWRKSPIQGSHFTEYGSELSSIERRLPFESLTTL